MVKIKTISAANAEPDDMDMGTSANGTGHLSQQPSSSFFTRLKGEYQLVSFLSCWEQKRTPSSTLHPSFWWMTAGLIKSPETIYSRSKISHTIRSTRVPDWKLYVENLSAYHSYTDYNKQVRTDPQLFFTFDIPKAKLMSSIKMNIMRESVTIHTIRNC